MHQFIRLVSLLAVALLNVSAGPTDESLFRMVMGQMRAAPFMGDARLSPAGTTCVNYYNNDTAKNVQQLSNATNACEEAANRTVVANNLNANASVAQVRSQLLQLEQNLQICKNQTDSVSYLNCTTSYFDKNLQLLDNSNSLAYQSQSQFASNATIVDAQRTNCISAAVSQAKVQSIQSANDYDTCVSKIANQREFSNNLVESVESQKPQKPQGQVQEQAHGPEHKHEVEQEVEVEGEIAAPEH